MRLPIFLLSISLAAAQQAPQPEVKAQDQCTIEGSVVNAKTKEPLRKAQVRLYPMGSPNGAPSGAVTDAAGKFKMTGVDPGRYRILAEKNGFTQAARHTGTPPSTLTLAAGQTLKDLEFPLSPAAVVAGRVVDEDGDAMVNVQVQALRYRYMQGRRQLVPSGNAATDDQGFYRIHSLTAGRYFLRATYSAMGALNVGSAAGPTPEEGYAPVYYPSGTDAAQAVAVQLREAEERRGVDFRLTPAHTVHVRGRVTTLPALPQAVIVMLMPRDMFGAMGMVGRSMGRVDRKGEFEIRGVSAGSYTAVAMWNRESTQLTAHQPIEVGNTNVEGVELTLKPGIELKGQVRAGAGTNADLELTSMRVRLMQDQSMPFGGNVAAALDADGSFAMKNIAEGLYQVSLYPLPADYYLKSLTYGKADALEKGISIGETAAGMIEIVISPDAGQINGTVNGDDGKPAVSASVVLVPEAKRPDLYLIASTDQSGRFVLRGVAPGNYQLYAWDNLEPGAYQDPAFLELYKDDAKKVTVEEKSRLTQDLTLLHAQAE